MAIHAYAVRRGLVVLFKTFISFFVFSSIVHAQPNFIIINTDDMNLTDLAFMPNVQSLLVNEGASFNNAFVTDDVCCPSRVSALRGQYTHNHEVVTNRGTGGGFTTFYISAQEESTLATWLTDAGYSTGLYGKYMNGYPDPDDETYVPPGWTEWHAFLQGANYFDYRMNQNGVLNSYGSAEEDYSTDVLTSLTLAFLDQYGDGSKPFFLYINPHAPHDPSTPAPRHENLFLDEVYPKNPNFNEADISDKADWLASRPLLEQRVLDSIEDQYKNRLRSLQSVDEMLAALVTRLEERRQLKNTFILFTSDNGISLGEHRLRAKGLSYEEAIRVPFVVRGPGIAKNVQFEQFALNIDIAPTIATLAEISIPSFVDGRSLASVMRGKNNYVELGESFLVERLVPLEGNFLTVPAYTAIRTRTHLYIDYDSGELEVYNLTADPYQLDSIHDTADPALLNKLQRDLNRLARCVGTTDCRPVVR